MPAYSICRLITILKSRRKLIFGSETIIYRHYNTPKHLYNIRTYACIGVDIAAHPSTSVKKNYNSGGLTAGRNKYSYRYIITASAPYYIVADNNILFSLGLCLCRLICNCFNLAFKFVGLCNIRLRV